MSSRASYVYSFHKTREKAEAALEEDYALGTVFPCEVDGIHFERLPNQINPKGYSGRWVIRLWAE